PYGGTDDSITRVTPPGGISRFPIAAANGYPVAITTGPDGNLWFTESDGVYFGQIARMRVPGPMSGGLDGDNVADLVWRQSETGDVAVWLMDGAVTVKQSTALAPDLALVWQIVGEGDLDGDGKADLVWRNRQTGDVLAWLMNGADVNL